MRVRQQHRYRARRDAEEHEAAVSAELARLIGGQTVAT